MSLADRTLNECQADRYYIEDDRCFYEFHGGIYCLVREDDRYLPVVQDDEY